MEQTITVKFIPSGRGKAQCPPNPEYPRGIDLDVSQGSDKTCKVRLDYPAPECGLWVLNCKRCGRNIAITAAGRPDDPRSVTIPC